MHTKGTLLAAAVLFACTGTLRAQYVTDFEGLAASAAGTSVTGQDGYYLPNATSVDFLAYTYVGNALGLPANPNGGSNFIAGTGPAGGIFARAQRNLAYSGGAGSWTAAFDICVTFVGALPSAQNVGSFSIQPFPGSQSFIALARWVDPATALNWNADYVHFDVAGAQLTSVVADPNFQNLAVNNWYRWETDFDLSTNQITELRITDLTTSTTTTHMPVGWYMEGGAGGSTTPSGLRWFGGGGVAGNTLCFDNARVAPKGAPGDILHYKFGGGCGDRVLNYGTANIAPAEGILETNNTSPTFSSWGPGQYGGGLAGGDNQSGTAFYNRVNTGWDGALAGPFSVAFWIQQANSPGTTLSYFYSGIGSFRCFTNGVAGSGLFTRAWGGPDLILTTDIQTPAAAGWTHIALVVDDAALMAEYYVNGVGQGPIAIPNGASIAADPPFLVGMHTSTGSASTYDMDEFRFANRAYSAAEVMAMASQHPAADTGYGIGCNAPASMWSIAGPPTLNNGNYGLRLLGPANGFAILAGGFDRCAIGPLALPLDLGVVQPGLAGCFWESSADFGTVGTALDGAGVGFVGVPIPNDPTFDQLPVYWHTLIFDPATQGGVLTNAWSTIVGN